MTRDIENMPRTKVPERAGFLTFKAKIYVSATFLASILILVSLQGWIVDDVIKEIKKGGIYEKSRYGKDRNGHTLPITQTVL